MKITVLRATKIWWGYIWRSWLLMLPVAVLVPLTLNFFGMVPTAGQPAMNPDAIPFFAAKATILWILSAIGMCAGQVVAIRWLMKTKWSDFKIALIPLD